MKKSSRPAGRPPSLNLAVRAGAARISRKRGKADTGGKIKLLSTLADFHDAELTLKPKDEGPSQVVGIRAATAVLRSGH
ncbi:MAG: hypothetical protein ACYC10_18255 [Allorhizobium sp.]